MFCRYYDSSAAAVAQETFRIREYRTETHGTCTRADGSTHSIDLAFMFVCLAVAHYQFYFRHVFDGGFQRTIFLYEVEHLVFCHREISENLAVVGYCYQRLAYAAVDQSADTIRYHGSDAVDRRFHHCIREVVVCAVHLGFRQCQFRFCLGEIVLRCHQLEF